MAEGGQTALSVRESQLLKMAAGGFTDVAIANKLGISEATVKTYWRRIRTKIGPYSRTELVATVLKSEMGRAVNAIREESLRQQDGSSAQHSLYKQLLENAPDAILIVSKDGAINMMNESAPSMFGWTQDDLYGKHISVLLPERYRAAHAEHVEEFVESPSKREMGEHMATSAVDKEGREFPIAASLASVGEGDEMHVICIVRSLRWKK